MDNQALEELNDKILHQVQHEIGHALESPAHINRVIGEAMRHIGSFLEISSSPYLPIRQEEIIAAPFQMQPGSTEAVLLLTRTIVADSSFLVMANSKTVNDQRTFDILAYKPDNFSLNKTKFLQLPPEVGNEIIRQLNVVIKGDGAALLQCVVIKNYFKVEEKKPEDGLFSSEVPISTEPSSPPPVANGLPPVSDEHLL